MNMGETIVFARGSAGAGSYPRSAERQIARLCNGWFWDDAAMATPRGVVHGFSNPHGVLARALVINTPDIGPKYFREVASITNASGPPDRAKLLATMRSFGLVPTEPPGNVIAATIADVCTGVGASGASQPNGS